MKFETKLKLTRAWLDFKNIILLLFLLNSLIGHLQQMADIYWGSGNLIIDNVPPKVEAKEATEVAEVENVINENPTLVKEIGEFSAYTADEAQTDSDPFTMASGKQVYEGAIANNCLEFGTKVEVNGKIKIVEDRMNKRYGCEYFDIYFEDYTEAVKFGRKELEYNILN